MPAPLANFRHGVWSCDISGHWTPVLSRWSFRAGKIIIKGMTGVSLPSCHVMPSSQWIKNCRMYASWWPRPGILKLECMLELTEGLLKHRWLGPTLEWLIQRVWGGAWEPAFLYVPRGYCCWWSLDPENHWLWYPDVFLYTCVLKMYKPWLPDPTARQTWSDLNLDSKHQSCCSSFQ